MRPRVCRSDDPPDGPRPGRFGWSSPCGAWFAGSARHGDPRWVRVSERVQMLPMAATAAPTPNAQGIPADCATNPSMIGPPPIPRSRNALAVPEAAPRSDGFVVVKIAVKKAGVLNATPTPSITAAASIPTGVAHTAVMIRPAAMIPRADSPSGSAGTRSGTLAKRTRQITTTMPYVISGMLGFGSPTASACSAAKARNPPMATTDVKNPAANGTVAQWIRGAGAPLSVCGERVSPRGRTTIAAIMDRAPAANQAAVNPAVLTSTSPRGGPNARPR